MSPNILIHIHYLTPDSMGIADVHLLIAQAKQEADNTAYKVSRHVPQISGR